LKFFGSYATSFIAPNLSQLFGPFGANPNLDPEENSTLEGGVEYRPSNKFRVSALYFNRNEDGRIAFVTIDPVTFESEFQNLTETTNFNGVELEVQAQPVENLNLTANYTYTDGDDGLALRIPQSKVNGTLGYDFGTHTFASISYQYVSDRDDTDFATFSPVDLEAFSLVNLYAKHDLCDTVGFFLALDNVFNTDYVEVTSFTTRGRNLRFGMQLHF